jgi:large subunit ribosomal protein L3
MKGLIGKKVGMTQLIADNGVATPVTLIQAGPCFVTQVRTPEKDAYSAVQLGFDEVNPSKLTGGQKGHLKRNGLNLPPLKVLREFRVDSADVKEGDKVTVDVFAVGEKVDIAGVSKGKGFAGGIKRHHFRRQNKTHGASDRVRSPGASSSNTTPGRLRKGKRAPGHMGTDNLTVRNIKIALVDVERNLLGVHGGVPGGVGAIVVIKPSR